MLLKSLLLLSLSVISFAFPLNKIKTDITSSGIDKRCGLSRSGNNCL